MNSTRQRMARFPLIQKMASLKIMVTCLILLFVLVFWGTIDQVNNGLYHAQAKFFHSFFFGVFGFLPFPGGQLVLWVMFINLLCTALVRFEYRLSNLGIILIHCGLLSYFMAAFITFHVVEESQLTLMEGETSNVSSAYHDWELSIWQQEGQKKSIFAIDAKLLKPGEIFDVDEWGFKVLIKNYQLNAEPYTAGFQNSGEIPLNASGIRFLKPLDFNWKEPAGNIPGGDFSVTDSKGKDVPLLLYGGEANPTMIRWDNKNFYFMLRHKKFVLPLSMKLLDFMKEVHPNTDTARSYKSRVEITTEGLSRELTIFMNHPLSYKNYTFYQASYSVDAQGSEHSTLAVVKNSGRLLPYLASLITFIGLVTHFLVMGILSRNKLKGNHVQYA